MIEELDEKVEAQVRYKASGNDDVEIVSNSKLSQLCSSDFEGIEL